MSFMGALLSGMATLRGRPGFEMVVHTLDFRLAVQFWGVEDPALAVLLYSVVGGTPAYRDGAAGGRGPASMDEFDAFSEQPYAPANSRSDSRSATKNRRTSAC